MTALSPALRASSSATVDVTVGAAGVRELAPQLARLAEAIPGNPITSRWPWMSASVAEPVTGQEPWLVSTWNADRMTAAALLIDDTRHEARHTTLAGTAEEHRGALLAADDVAAGALGRALAAALTGRPREFSLGPLAQSPALAGLLDHLPVRTSMDEVAIPLVRTTRESDCGMSHGMIRTLRKAANRMARDEVTPQITMCDAADEIVAVLPLLESVSRDRDLASGRPSPLDDPARRRLWQRRVVALAATGQLRLVTLRLDRSLAAYVLGIEDNAVYRVLEGRYVSRWARYSPGRVLEAAVVEAAVSSPDIEVLDWMTGIAPETLIAANDVERLYVVSGRS